MVNQHYSSSCFNCLHYCPITDREKEEIKPFLGGLSDRISFIKGVCIGSGFNDNHFIQRIIEHNFYTCSSFRKGYSRESLHIECPSCHIGAISISRPFIRGSTVIIIGCNRYPYCDYSVNQLKLNQKCRFCGSSLYLIGGNILKCKCLNCSKGGNGVNIPISIKIYPSLAMPEGGCIHSGSQSNCENCATSRRERKNLLEIELPQMFPFPVPQKESQSNYSSEPKSKWRPIKYWGEDEWSPKPEDIEPDFYPYSKAPYDEDEEEDREEFQRDINKMLNDEEVWE